MYSKKHFFLFPCLFFCLLFLASMPSLPCQAAQPRVRIVASTYPIYLFTQAVAQGLSDVQVELLIPAQAGCPHEYILTPKDMQKLSTANILVINGLGMEDFMAKSLADQRYALIDSSIGIQPLASAAGHQHRHAAHGEEHVHHAGEQHHHMHGERNPHPFSSPRQAAMIVRTIACELGELDARNADAYARAAEAYARRLEALAAKMSSLGNAKNKKIVLLHEAAAYLVRDAGLELVGVIQQSENMQLSAASLLQMTQRLQEEKPAAIACEPQYSDKPARALAAATGLPVIYLDPVASGPLTAGPEYYEEVMNRNYSILEEYFVP